MVLIEEVEFEDIKAGDVITFRNSDNTKRCTHRVVEIDNENRAFVTKGDNNNIKDPYSVGYEYVIGRVKISLPLAGYIFGLFDTPAARITAVILAVVYVSCEIELYRIKRKERDEK